MTETETLVAIFDGAAVYVRQGWTRGAVARNAVGKCVAASHRTACEWCVTGAVGAATTDLDTDDATAYAAFDITDHIARKYYLETRAWLVNDHVAVNRQTPLRLLRLCREHVIAQAAL